MSEPWIKEPWTIESLETGTLDELAGLALAFVRVCCERPHRELTWIWVSNARALDEVLTARLKQAFEDPQLDEPLSVAKAARLYRVTRAALYLAIKEGRVCGSRDSGAWLVTRRAIDYAIKDKRIRVKRDRSEEDADDQP